MDVSGARWRKSSYSGGNNDCVEVAFVGDQAAFRDSKAPACGVLVFEPSVLRSFMAGLRHAYC